MNSLIATNERVRRCQGFGGQEEANKMQRFFITDFTDGTDEENLTDCLGGGGAGGYARHPGNPRILICLEKAGGNRRERRERRRGLGLRFGGAL
jgi:hypothetical protein